MKEEGGLPWIRVQLWGWVWRCERWKTRDWGCATWRIVCELVWNGVERIDSQKGRVGWCVEQLEIQVGRDGALLDMRDEPIVGERLETWKEGVGVGGNKKW